MNNKAVHLKKITSKKVYWEIVKFKIKPPSAKDKWFDLFPFLDHIDWTKIYRLTYTVSKEPYLQTFQYKILNRTTNCRYNLWKWNLLPSGKCQFCVEIDTIEHHFYYCSVSRRFWSNVLKWFQSKTSFTVDLSVCEVLFGVTIDCYGDKEIFNSVNLVILLAKWYIDTNRTLERDLSLSPFLNLVNEKLKILKMNYSLDNNVECFYKLYGVLNGY